MDHPAGIWEYGPLDPPRPPPPLGSVTDNVNCLIIIITKDDNNIAAVHFKINLFDFYHWSIQLTDFCLYVLIIGLL